MPLVDIRQLTPDTRMGLWCIEATTSEPFPTPRRRERQAVQALLNCMTGNSQYTIGHKHSGKPFVEGGTNNKDFHVSISHTKGYAVILLSSRQEITGVDIEYRSDRVERIAHRFIRSDEHANTTDEKLLVWSAKETVYKLYSEDNLKFFDMQTTDIGEHCLQMKNLRRNTTVNVFYEFTDSYVLTYAILPAQVV